MAVRERPLPWSDVPRAHRRDRDVRQAVTQRVLHLQDKAEKRMSRQSGVRRQARSKACKSICEAMKTEATIYMMKMALDETRSTFERVDAAKRVIARLAKLVGELDAEEVRKQRRRIVAAADRSVKVGEA